jgi:beta-1,4-mannooligosaccharide phosphorylase
MKRMERRSHRAHPHIAPDAFPLSRDEGAGEGRGEGSLILQWDNTGGHAKPLLSPALSSISWRRGSLTSGDSGALSGCDRACGTVPAWIPVASYERTGFFGNVVFTNGHLVDGDTVTMYYGASDSVICGARFSLHEILQTLRSSAL